MGVQSTAGRLADGREIVYYGSEPSMVPTVAPVDTRDMATSTASSEVRWNPLLGQPVVVASHRQDRTHLPSAEDCPLCPSRPGRPTEIPASFYQVVVFENRFPALSATASWSLEPIAARLSQPCDLIGRRAPGTGRCEVVCFTAEHHASFADLSKEHARLVVDVMAERTSILQKIPGIVQVFCFENRGPEIGVTEPHPHGQIYAYPFVAPRMQRLLDNLAYYRNETGRSLIEDVVAWERSSERVVAETSHWTAFVPFAPRWPYEVHLYPKRPVRAFPDLSEAQRDELAVVYLDLLDRLDRLFGMPAPYIAAWHQAPAGCEEAAFHLELMTSRRAPDKLKFLAGSEAAMDVFIGDIVPEKAAERLRELASERTPSFGQHD